MTRQDELARQGWQRKSTYDEPRLSEMADMYKDIGLEVHLEPFHADEITGLGSGFWRLACQFSRFVNWSNGQMVYHSLIRQIVK
jgi:hypothetical protein